MSASGPAHRGGLDEPRRLTQQSTLERARNSRKMPLGALDDAPKHLKIRRGSEFD